MPVLSVIVPVYNESGTIRQILEKIQQVPIDKELIVVDDGSTDGTAKLLRELKYDNLKIIYHSSNRGKGAAVITGLAQSSGELIVIQDADLEYEPREYINLLEEYNKGGVDIMQGARFTNGYHGLLIPKLGNRFLTSLLNLLFGTKFNDCLTCYKLFRKSTIESLNLGSKGFDLEVEIIAKATRKHLVIREIPIAYQPRDYSQGKKIRWKDGIRIILSIIKNRFQSV